MYHMNAPLNKRPILIFDFDGTIADTHHYIVTISNRLSEEFNYLKIPPEEIEHLKDHTVQEVIQHLKVPWLKIPAIITRAKEEFYSDIRNIKPIEGLSDVLRSLKKADVHIGILSSNSIENIQYFLSNHDLDFFDFIESTSKIWGKNISLKKMIDHLHLVKENIIYIGDEIRDVEAAKKINMKVAAVTWGYNSGAALQKRNPDFLIHTPQELFQLCPAFTDVP